jgi:hypothetical protein
MMYLFFSQRSWRAAHHCTNRRKRSTTHTHTHTQDSDNEDDTTPALMNQQGPIVHEQDPFVWPGMAIRYTGHREVPNSNTRLAHGHHLYKTGDWKAFKKPRMGKKNE